jgi:conjugative transfer signal peptidase TraF
MSQPLLVLALALALGILTALAFAKGVSANTRLARVLWTPVLVSLIAVVALVILGSGLRVNFTPSMPLGIYRLEPLPTGGVERGMFVAVCAPPNADELGRRRGYLSTGPCPDDTEMLLKAVPGVPGDDIEVSVSGIAVNRCALPHSAQLRFDRAGRPLLRWSPAYYHLGRGQVWLYADDDRSWDSRYFGPVPTANVVARAFPLLVAQLRATPLPPRGCGRID